MPRTRKKTEVQTAPAETETLPPGATDFNPGEFDQAAQDQVTADHQAEAATAVGEAREQNGNGHAERYAPSGNGYAASVARKPYTRPADPFGFENIKAGENRV